MLPTTEILSLVGILVGPAGVIGGYALLRKLQPDTESVVMTTTDTGVKVLSGVVETVSAQWERAEAARLRCEEQIVRRDRYIRQLIEEHEADVHDKNFTIAQLRDELIARRHGRDSS
jgi:threonine synthase